MKYEDFLKGKVVVAEKFGIDTDSIQPLFDLSEV